MKRYFTIYFVLLRLNFSALVEYRANFFNSLIGTTGWAVVSVVSMLLLTSRIKTVYGWTPDELLAVTALYSILIGIFSLFFSRNFERFAKIINKGDLDAVLLKPVDSQFLLSCSIVNYSSITRVIIGISFLWYILQKMHTAISIVGFMSFTFLTFCGILLLYSLWFCVLTLIIKISNLTNITDFLYGFNNLGRYPPEMIKQTKNIFIFILLPFTLTATIPVKALLTKASFIDIIILSVFSFLLFIGSRFFWKFALKSYTSASG